MPKGNDMADELVGVCYRKGTPTVVDYDEAIETLQNARRDLAANDHMGCSVCGDSGHSFSTCHHNPLLLARQWAEATGVWQCYHCGFIATNDEEARDHFGEAHQDAPKCRFKSMPARLSRPSTAEAVAWRCFHCDEVFTDQRCAADHFGAHEDCEPACRIKMGAERSLLTALRRAESDANEMMQRLSSETTDSAKAYYAQNARHQEQLRVAEELGFERGLAAARNEEPQL